MKLLKSGATVYAGIQTGKGTPKVLTGADAVDILKDAPLIWPKGEAIESELNRHSRFPAAKLISGQWGEGGLNCQMRGSGTPGTEPTGLAALLKGLFGSMLTNASGTVEVGSGAVGGFDSNLDLTVGQLVRVDVSSGVDDSAFEIRRIATKAGGGAPYTYTVQRNFSAAPGDGATIAAGVTFTHLGTETEQYLTIEQYIRSNKHLFTDASVDGMSMSIAAKALIKIAFDIRSIGYAKSAAADPYTPVYDNTQGLTANQINMIIGATAINMKQVDTALKTRRDFTGVNDNGLGDLDWMDVFEANGKVTPWVEDFSYFDTFFAGTLANIELTPGSVAGNILHIEMAGCQYTGAEVGEDDGAFVWDLPFDVTGGYFIGFF